MKSGKSSDAPDVTEEPTSSNLFMRTVPDIPDDGSRESVLSAAWDPNTDDDDSDSGPQDEATTVAAGTDASTDLDHSNNSLGSTSSRGYLENLAPSRGLAVFLGVCFTLILVVPVTLASTGKGQSQEATNNATSVVNTTAVVNNTTNDNATDVMFEATINETTLQQYNASYSP